MEPTDFKARTPELDRAIEQGLVPDQMGLSVEMVPDIVSQIAALIPTTESYADCLPEALRAPLRAIQLEGFRSPMLLGRKGLPNTSARLVKMGIFLIEDNHIVLHPVLRRAFEEKSAARDALLERLRRMRDDLALDDQSGTVAG
jgi:hypothetical protein